MKTLAFEAGAELLVLLDGAVLYAQASLARLCHHF